MININLCIHAHATASLFVKRKDVPQSSMESSNPELLLFVIVSKSFMYHPVIAPTCHQYQPPKKEA